MSKKLFIFISMFLLLAAFACQNDDTATLDNTATVDNTAAVDIKVSATVPMISEWANKVSGTRVTVDSIIPHSTNPHGYQPGAKDVAKFSESDLILAIGLVYEEAWLDKLIDSHSDIKLIELGEFVDPIKARQYEDEHDEHDEHKEGDKEHEEYEEHKEGDKEHEEHEEHKEGDKEHEEHEEHKEGDKEHEEHEEHEGHDHGHGEFDPHFWFDPIRVTKAVSQIAAGLTEIDPEGKEYYESNAKAYIDELIELDKFVSSELSKISHALMTEHDSLGYLGDRYGIEILKAIIPATNSEAGSTAKDLIDAVRLIDDHEVTVILLEREVTSDVAVTVADEAGIGVASGLNVESLGIGQSYVDFMKNNIDVIVSNLVKN